MKELSRRTVLACYPEFLGEEAVRAYLDSGAADAEFDEHLHQCHVMEGEGVLLGCCILNGDRIHLMMVDVAHQRRSYGGQLLAYAEGQLRDIGFGEINLQTFEHNTQAINFYLKNGWEQDGHERVAELGMNMLFFKKRLG